MDTTTLTTVKNRKISSTINEHKPKDPFTCPKGDKSEHKKDDQFQSRQFPQVFATIAVTLSAFGMGLVEAYPSPGLPSMEQSGILGPLPVSEQSKIASFALFAALLSGPAIGGLVGKVGRKIILIILTIPFVAGWLIMASASSIAMMYLGRILTGFCAGAASLVVPIYIGEVSEDRIRGMLSSGFQLMVTLGNLYVYTAGTFMDWQWLAASCAVFPLLGGILMLFIPRSPRFLLTRGKQHEATAALMWLRGASCSEEVQSELNSMQSNIEMCNKEGGTLKNIFKTETLKPMMICLVLLIFQQLSGIEAMLAFTVHVFREAGSTWDPNICTIIIGVLQVIVTFSSAAIVDRAGRRRLLMISELGAALAMLTLTVFFYFHDLDPTLSERMGWIPLASLASFIMFFAIGIGPVPFLLIAELNGPAMVGIASAAGTTCNWTISYGVTAIFMYIEEGLGLYVCFGLLSSFSLVGLFFVYMFVPETKGRSMEEIQKNYFQKNKDNNILTISKIVCSP